MLNIATTIAVVSAAIAILYWVLMPAVRVISYALDAFLLAPF